MANWFSHSKKGLNEHSLTLAVSMCTINWAFTSFSVTTFPGFILEVSSLIYPTNIGEPIIY